MSLSATTTPPRRSRTAGRPQPGPGRTARRPARPARPEGLALPVHRAVLHHLRHLRRSTRWCGRCGCRCTTGTWSTSGPRATPSSASTTTSRCSSDDYFWNALSQHVRHLPARHDPAAAAGAVPGQPAQPAAAAGRDLLADGDLRAERHLGRRRSPSSSARCSRATSASSTGCSSLVGVGARSTGTGPESWSSWTAIAAMVDWRWTGYNALILLAGMQAIPRDLYESAVDRRRGPVAAVLVDHAARCCGRPSSS